MTNLTTETSEIDQTVWRQNNHGNWSVLTIKAIGNSTVKCSDGNTYNLKPGESEGDLRGEKYGPRISTDDKTKDIAYQEKMKVKKVLSNEIKNFMKAYAFEQLTIEQLEAIKAIIAV